MCVRIHGASLGAESADRRAVAIAVIQIRFAPMRASLLVVLVSASIAWTDVATASGATPGCPDVSGRYSVTGLGPARSNALAAMQASMADYLDSGVELSGAVDGTLAVWTKSGSSGSWSTQPTAVLRAGTDFECVGGRLILSRPVLNATRKTEEGKWYQGEATTTLSRIAGGELSIAVRFTGSERISLYRYESANVTIPKPGTRTTLTDIYRWPAYSNTDSLATTPPAVPEVERAARQLLTPQVLGNVVLAWLKPSGDGILVTLKVPRSNDVEAFEDRLRAASIAYETREGPIWSNNAYHMELLIRPAGAVAGLASRPSAFRIEKELQRSLPALVDVDKVAAAADGYVVTLNISDSTPIADVIRRVQLNSTMIGTMKLIEESTSAGSQVRIVRLDVRLR